MPFWLSIDICLKCIIISNVFVWTIHGCEWKIKKISKSHLNITHSVDPAWALTVLAPVLRVGVVTSPLLVLHPAPAGPGADVELAILGPVPVDHGGSQLAPVQALALDAPHCGPTGGSVRCRQELGFASAFSSMAPHGLAKTLDRYKERIVFRNHLWKKVQNATKSTS